MKKLRLEAWLDEEFRLMGVEPYIHHIKLINDAYFNVVTVAAPHHISYDDIVKQLAIIVGNCCEAGRTDYGRFLVDAFSKIGWGVALCHHSDQFSRKRGRIIATGRLLKRLRKEGLKRAYREYAFGNCVYPHTGVQE